MNTNELEETRLGDAVQENRLQKLIYLGAKWSLGSRMVLVGGKWEG
jgi:hypothetical protein